jgi:predicted ATPase
MFEPMQPNPNLIVITGAPGAGKTTLLNLLATRGYTCVPEAARQIIREQQATNGDAVPWSNTTAYINLMLDRSIASYLDHQHADQPTFFDRGLPDTLGYARIIQLPDPSPIRTACNPHRYANPIFVAPPWLEIYATDDQRKQTFDEAILSFHQVLDAYHSCGYQTIPLPESTPEQRADFVLAHLR